jgi:hypothetical protein
VIDSGKDRGQEFMREAAGRHEVVECGGCFTQREAGTHPDTPTDLSAPWVGKMA